MNKTVSIVVRGTFAGKRVNGSLDPEKREVGLSISSYWLKWLVDGGQKWDGPHKDEWVAKAAKVRKERELRGIAVIDPRPTANRLSIDDAIAHFVEVQRIESQDGRSADRWKWELSLFKTVTGRRYGRAPYSRCFCR